MNYKKYFDDYYYISKEVLQVFHLKEKNLILLLFNDEIRLYNLYNIAKNNHFLSFKYTIIQNNDYETKIFKLNRLLIFILTISTEKWRIKKIGNMNFLKIDYEKNEQSYKFKFS